MPNSQSTDSTCSDTASTVPGLQNLNHNLGARFAECVNRLNRKIDLWPHTNCENLTAFLPQLRKILENLLLDGHQLVENYVAFRDGMFYEGETNYKTVTEFCESFKLLLHTISTTLCALSSIYLRIHGRESAPWRVIQYMWPIHDPQVNLIFPEEFRVAMKYGEAEDLGLKPRTQESLNRLVTQGALVELRLWQVKLHGRRVQDHFMLRNITLDDGDGYNRDWEADNEATEGEET